MTQTEIAASPRGIRARPLLGLALALGAAATVLVLWPAGARAAITPGCMQTNAPPPGGAEEWVCHHDPITIGGYEVKEATVGAKRPAADGHITQMEVDVVDASGAPIPIFRIMLHHIVFANLSRQDKTCSGYTLFDNRSSFEGYAPERFYAAGEERAKATFPPGYGYPLSGPWVIVYMLMNHRQVPDTAYIQYKMTIDPDPSIKSADPYWLDVANCRADPIYNVPGASWKARRKARRRGTRLTHRRSRSFTIQQNGWIVGGAGHVHGGARRLTITKPGCNNKRVAQSVPTWGFKKHPFYRVKPVLHESGPIGMSAFTTPTGIPVRAGQRIRLNSLYENSRPHVRVMGIMVVYVAPDDPGGRLPQRCGGAPADTRYWPGTNLKGRKGPVRHLIPLTGLRNGTAVTIRKPPGRTRRLRSGAKVRVGDRFFSRTNVVLRRGAKLRYRFDSAELHNLTLASGPVGIGSPNLDQGRVYVQRFRRPGVYKFFCALHPVQMTQRVIVKRRRR